MGCQASSDAQFDQALDQELQHELNFVDHNKKGEQIDRFQGTTPEQGFDSLLFQAEQETQQQFMAVKPWIGALKAPTQAPSPKNEEPAKNLKLQFINGFKVQDSRQNMFWGKNKDQIVYPAASVGVCMNIKTLKQRYMGTGVNKEAKGHTDDIVSLGICPNRKLAVTGSLGARPLILVWDIQTMEIKARTNLGRNTRAVSTIRFSKDGKYFFCTDKHNESNVYCFETETAKKVGENKCGSDPVFDADTGDANTFAVATKRGMWFFNLDQSGLDKKKGLFNGNDMQPMITCTYDPEAKCFYSGTAKGSIYTWQGNSCTKSVKVHEGSVMGLAFASGKLLSSGSKDGLIKISKNGQVEKQIKIEGYAKSLDLLNGNILAATKYGEILSINESTSAITKVMQGHWTGQTWGLAIGPDGNVYSTADDNKILCFNPKTFKVQKKGVINEQRGRKRRILGASTLSMLPPNQHARAVAVSAAGHVAIGTNDGELSIRKTSDLSTQIYGQKASKQWIEVIKYSPDQTMLAVGSHDNNIYIYKINGDSYEKHGALKAHNSFITNLDWSKDSKSIHSNCGAYEYLFFDVQNLQQLKSGATQLRDEKWATYSVKLGWWVQGIFPRGTSGDHINGVDRNHGQDIVATGDDWGFVNLYGNPTTKNAKCKAYRAHSSHVVRVLFDKNDSFLYSVGGYDKTLMMWKVE